MSSDISVCHQYISVTMYAYDDMSPDISVCHQYVSNYEYICLLIPLYVTLALNINQSINQSMSPICLFVSNSVYIFLLILVYTYATNMSVTVYTYVF